MIYLDRVRIEYADSLTKQEQLNRVNEQKQHLALVITRVYTNTHTHIHTHTRTGRGQFFLPHFPFQSRQQRPLRFPRMFLLALLHFCVGVQIYRYMRIYICIYTETYTRM